MMLKKNIYKIISKIRGDDFEDQYLEIKKIQTRENLIEFKTSNLKKLLLHSSKHVPYYHHLLRNLGVVHDDIVELSKFNKIPILTKELIHSEELVSDDYLTRYSYNNFSGGSMGEPTKFIQDLNYRKWVNATNEFYYNDILDIDEVNVKKILLWGSPRDLFKGNMGIKAKIGTWLTNTVFLNSFRLTDEDMEKYVNTINAFQPVLIRGYAVSLFELSRFIGAEHKELKDTEKKSNLSGLKDYYKKNLI